MDYSKYKVNNKIYTGSEEKFGITINGELYIVKFQKNSEHGLTNNHISEHIGSSIFRLLKESAQETMLGTYKGRNVVICKDFTSDEETFTPFNGIGESTLERDKNLYTYSYGDIIAMLKENSKLTNADETIEKFWNMYVIDAFIGNFDRHGANWGFIKRNNNYTIAPIFDNGSSLFPRRNSDELLMEVLNDKDVLNEITFKYPTSQIRLNNQKSSYYEVINSLAFEECNKALQRIYERINMKEIHEFIDLQDAITMLQKRFYKHVLSFRYEKIIKASFLKLIGDQNA